MKIPYSYNLRGKEIQEYKELNYQELMPFNSHDRSTRFKKLFDKKESFEYIDYIFDVDKIFKIYKYNNFYILMTENILIGYVLFDSNEVKFYDIDYEYQQRGLFTYLICIVSKYKNFDITLSLSNFKFRNIFLNAAFNPRVKLFDIDFKNDQIILTYSQSLYGINIFKIIETNIILKNIGPGSSRNYFFGILSFNQELNDNGIYNP